MITDSEILAVLVCIYHGEPVAVARRIDRAKACVLVLSDKKVLRLTKNPRYSALGAMAAYEKWRKHSVPTPHVYAAGEVDGVQYLLMTYLEDAVFSFSSTTASQINTVAQMGALLARMREIKVNGFGRIGGDGCGQFSSWAEAVRDVCPLELHALAGHLSEAQVATLQRLQVSIPAIDEPVLLHGDFKQTNMFVNQRGEITAVSDPRPLGGDPLWDVAVCNHFLRREQARQGRPIDDEWFSQLRTAFSQGYEAELGRTLAEDERLRTTLYEIMITAHKMHHWRSYGDNEAKHMLGYLAHQLDAISY